MNVVILDGIMGAGKTMAMTLLCKYFESKSGCTLYSNNGIEGSLPFTHYRDFLHVAQQPSSLIALDESHSDLDARNFNTNAVKYFTHLVFYFRKMRTTMFFTTPLLDNLDSRVRGVCNLYCRCTKDKRNFYYDMYDLQAGKHLKRFTIDQKKAFQIVENFYDTHSMVTPLEWPSERADFTKFLHELKESTDLYYANLRGKNLENLVLDREGAEPVGLRPDGAADDLNNKLEVLAHV